MSTKAPPQPVRPHPTTPRPANTDVALFDELDLVLRDLLKEHQLLLSLTADHRRAIASADVAGLSHCIRVQSETALRVAALEKKRQSVVARISAARPDLNRANPKNANTHTITMLAAAAPEPVRTRLAGVTKALRDLLNALHKEHVAIRQAAETLSSHMEGLMRQACQRLSHAGTYARSGTMDSTVQVVSAIDVRS